MMKELNLLSCMWREEPRHEVVVKEARMCIQLNNACIKWVPLSG